MKSQIRILSTMSGLMLLVLGFQNCAPGVQLADLGAEGSALVNFNVGYQRRFSAENLATGDARSATDLMSRLKYQSCMFDGLLTDPVEASYDDLLARSACAALPRAIETWAKPPNFEQIQNRIQQIAVKTAHRDFDFGMFIAEAVSLDQRYADEYGNAFDFAKMCNPGTVGHWGANTCIPGLMNEEYRRYVLFISKRAIDLGARNILFGQSGHQDPTQVLPEVVSEIRAYANSKNQTVLIGQQPNGHQPESYLKAFDFIVGPVYVDIDASQPCVSGQYPNCQAVLHHPDVVGRAHNVIAEIDWASVVDDDAHKFARKTAAERQAFLIRTVQELRARNVGFNLPFRLWLTGDTSGTHCFGPNPWNYSPDKNFGCKDEDVINAILNGTLAVPVSESATITSQEPRTSSSVASPIETIVEVYVQYLDRDYDSLQSDLPGIGYWVDQLRAGLSKESFIAQVKASDEYFVRQSYKTYLKRSGALREISYWIGEIASGRKSRTAVVADLQYACANRLNGECR